MSGTTPVGPGGSFFHQTTSTNNTQSTQKTSQKQPYSIFNMKPVGAHIPNYRVEETPIVDTSELITTDPDMVYFLFPFEHKLAEDSTYSEQSIKVSPVAPLDAFVQPRRFRQGENTQYTAMLLERRRRHETYSAETAREDAQWFCEWLARERKFLQTLLDKNDQQNALSHYVNADVIVQKTAIFCEYLKKFHQGLNGFTFVLEQKNLSSRIEAIYQYYLWYTGQNQSEYASNLSLKVESDFEFVLRKFSLKAIEFTLELWRVESLIKANQFYDARAKLLTIKGALLGELEDKSWHEIMNDLMRDITQKTLEESCNDCCDVKHYSKHVANQILSTAERDNCAYYCSRFSKDVVALVLNIVLPYPWLKAAMNPYGGKQALDLLAAFFEKNADDCGKQKNHKCYFYRTDLVHGATIAVTHPDSTPEALLHLIDWLSDECLPTVQYQMMCEAIHFNKVEMVAFLIEKYGVTPFVDNCIDAANYDYISEQGFQDNQKILELMLKALDDESFDRHRYMRLIATAVQNQDVASLELILEHYRGETPLSELLNSEFQERPYMHRAALGLNVEMIQLLVNFDANLEHKNTKGVTAYTVLSRQDLKHPAYQKTLNALQFTDKQKRKKRR